MLLYMLIFDILFSHKNDQSRSFKLSGTYHSQSNFNFLGMGPK